MIKKKWLLLLFGAVLGISLAWAGAAAAQEKVLQVYGPGGPLGPMQECGAMFFKARGVEVKVTAGPTPNGSRQPSRMRTSSSGARNTC